MPKPKTRTKDWLVGQQKIDDWLAIAQMQMARQDYDGTLRTAKRILKYVPKNTVPYADALGIIGMVYGLQKQFEMAFQTLSRALEANPKDPTLWFNRSLSALYTSRSGIAWRDIQQAVYLEGSGKMAAQFREKEAFVRGIVESELALRGKDFTVDQLIEQQELFQEGNGLSMQGKWPEAEACFRKAIAMSECLPQPTANLGICLAMQKRFDEAEAAYKRALEIDPGYKRAKEHLVQLKDLRAHPDETPGFAITSPFQNAKTGLKIIKE